MSQIEVIIVEVLDLLKKLKSNKSVGPEGIHLRILKGLICGIVILLKSIWNLLLNICRMTGKDFKKGPEVIQEVIGQLDNFWNPMKLLRNRFRTDKQKYFLNWLGN